MSAVLAALAAALLASPQVQAPSTETLAKWGNEIGALLLKGDTDAVALRFAPNVVAVLPPGVSGRGGTASRIETGRSARWARRR